MYSAASANVTSTVYTRPSMYAYSAASAAQLSDTGTNFTRSSIEMLRASTVRYVVRPVNASDGDTTKPPRITSVLSMCRMYSESSRMR